MIIEYFLVLQQSIKNGNSYEDIYILPTIAWKNYRLDESNAVSFGQEL
jgi:hypothetical protein